jgi:glycosyltransferase involved in cell wall biosynthesis
MNTLRLTHLFTSFQDLGGVSAVLQHHHKQDLRWGINSDFVIFAEKQARPIERVHFLGLDAHSTIRLARDRLRQAVAQSRSDIAVYHTTWGMPYLSDLDRSNRRILMQHGQVPGLAATLQFRRDWLDGVVCIGEPLVQTVRECLPKLEAHRITVLPCPIIPPHSLPPRRLLGKRPLILGFCGRISTQQKRVDRFPKLCACLDQRGLSYRLEFLGEGTEQAWLERKLADRSKFQFHGRKNGEEYWGILSNWDVILFLSDYEGVPLALLEALSAGVIPCYPRISSGGEAYVASVRPDLVYAPEDYSHVAEILTQLSRLPESDWEKLRSRAREATTLHLGDNYMKTFSEFVRQIGEMPKVSKATFPRLPFFVEDCSFTWLARLGAVRRAFLRLRAGILSSLHPKSD